MNNLYNLLNIPDDIIDIIIPYTYKTQNKELLDDIINYNITKEIIIEKYKKKYKFLTNGIQLLEDKYWLINDLDLYFNNNKSYSEGYLEVYYEKWLRLYNIKNKEDVKKYINVMDRCDINTQINSYWGILNINEREDFIKRIEEF
tara:strand:+ start:933 stop:1367 length:435 start_codon:yes stop_codon:yes gene_type:complete